MNKLSREFYRRDARLVARDLLGKELVRITPEGTASGIIVETEAYMGVTDRASHAFGGRMSRRTSIMFGEAGHAYVYLIYGMYWCLNITASEEGTPECVLIRALEPVSGLELIASRRSAVKAGKACALANGPGKLCRALAIDGSLYGEDMCGDMLFVRNNRELRDEEIAASKRINIDYAGDAALCEWRYYLKGNRCVSKTSF